MTDWSDPEARRVRTKMRRLADSHVRFHHVGQSTLGRATPLEQLDLYADALCVSTEEALARAKHQVIRLHVLGQDPWSGNGV